MWHCPVPVPTVLHVHLVSLGNKLCVHVLHACYILNYFACSVEVSYSMLSQLVTLPKTPLTISVVTSAI